MRTISLNIFFSSNEYCCKNRAFSTELRTRILAQQEFITPLSLIHSSEESFVSFNTRNIIARSSKYRPNGYQMPFHDQTNTRDTPTITHIIYLVLFSLLNLLLWYSAFIASFPTADTTTFPVYRNSIIQ